MIPSNSAPVAGHSFHRDSNNAYSCPIDGCSQSFGARASLQSHITQAHMFRGTESPNGVLRSDIASSTKNYATNTPHIRRVLQPQQHASFVAYPPAPNGGQMLPPGGAASSIAETESQAQSHPANWIETTVWPEKTENFLRELVHSYALYTSSTSPEEQHKLHAIFDAFYEKTDFRTYKPPKGDERLWQLFRAKVEQIQTEIILQGEYLKATNGGNKRRALPWTIASTSVNTPETLTTPPATPVLGSDKECDILELWNGLDVDMQTALFRQQLRSAKNRKALMLEWNEYCGEIREKRAAKNRDSKSATPGAQSSDPKTPLVLPAPQNSASIDVKEIIAKKLRELQMKKDKDLLRASEERASKRLRTDST